PPLPAIRSRYRRIVNLKGGKNWQRTYCYPAKVGRRFRTLGGNAHRSQLPGLATQGPDCEAALHAGLRTPQLDLRFPDLLRHAAHFSRWRGAVACIVAPALALGGSRKTAKPEKTSWLSSPSAAILWSPSTSRLAIPNARNPWALSPSRVAAKALRVASSSGFSSPLSRFRNARRAAAGPPAHPSRSAAADRRARLAPKRAGARNRTALRRAYASRPGRAARRRRWLHPAGSSSRSIGVGIDESAPARGAAAVDRAHELDDRLGQRAGLVGAQHVHRAKVMDRRKAFDDHLALGQFHRRASQRDGHDHRKQLGRQPDGQRQREHQRFQHRPVEEDVDHQD